MTSTLTKWNVQFNVIADGALVTESDIDVAAFSAAHAMDVAAKFSLPICRGTKFVWVPTAATETGDLV